MRGARPLIDREREIASLDSLLEGAVSGSGRLLAVCGFAGTGKTTLLDHAAGIAVQRGMTVLSAWGGVTEVNVSFGMVRQLFQSYPDVAVLAERGADGLSGALIEMAASAPVLVVVDDVQRSDRPSLLWLASLAPRIARHGIALLVSACPGDPAMNPALVDELIASGAGELHIAGFTRAAAAEFLGVDDDRLAEIWELSGGNPALLAGLAARLPGREFDSRGVVVPQLTRTVHVWLRRTSPHAVVITRAVAVLGGHATVDRAARIVGMDLAALANVVVALERKGLMRTTARGGVGIVPLIVGTIVVRELSFVVSQKMHGHVASLLHESNASASDIAEHLLVSGPITTSWAVTALRSAAARALRRGCPDVAKAMLEHAATGPVSKELLVELGRAAAHSDVFSAIRYLSLAVENGADATNELAQLRVVAGDETAAADDPGHLGSVERSFGDRQRRVGRTRVGHQPDGPGAFAVDPAIDRCARSGRQTRRGALRLRCARNDSARGSTGRHSVPRTSFGQR